MARESRRTDTPQNGIRPLALFGVVAVHLPVAIILLRQIPPLPNKPAALALQVVWIETMQEPSWDHRSPDQSPDRTPTGPAPALPTVTAAQPTTPTPPMAASPDLVVSALEASGPRQAYLLAQARRWASEASTTETPADVFTVSPLQSRGVIDSEPDAFRVTERITPQDIARGIGQLFGGLGYTDNPCPQIQRNIGRLAPAGDSELLQEELRRRRFHKCT